MRIEQQHPRFYNRLKVFDGDRTVLALNLGGSAKDLFLMRPCIHPFYTPKGYPVTEMGAHNFPHHKGVWVGHAQINGVNFFHDLPDAGWIVPIETHMENTEISASIRLTLEWRDQRGTVIATETRHHTVRRERQAHVLDIVTALHASHGSLDLGVDNHAWIGCRTIDALDYDDGGQMLDSEGRQGPDAINGNPVRWIDISGTIGEHACGIALLAHPDSSPIPVFARFYGTNLLNPTMFEPLHIDDGNSRIFGARVVAHDGLPSATEMNDWWSTSDQEYLQRL